MNITCNKHRITLFISVLLLGMVNVNIANAAIINLNALSNTTTNPVSLSLTAGTYNITPIGTADGGDYNAWNAWGHTSGCDSSGANCITGWLNRYSLSSSEFAPVTYSDGNKYQTPLLALANAIDSSFTLTIDTTVDFFITDDPYWDNEGGMSLRVDPVPVPTAIWLFGSGLIGLLGITRHKRVA